MSEYRGIRAHLGTAGGRVSSISSRESSSVSCSVDRWTPLVRRIPDSSRDMNLAALLSAAAASPLLPIPKHEPPATNTFPAHHETPPTRPFPSLDHADRGTKRKLSGWTAPLPVYPVQGTDLAMLDERKHAVEPPPPPPAVIVKSESEDSAPAEAVVAASQFARMGTRVPGSGDLGNTGARERMWPVLRGVSVGVRREEEELVLEEECYSWTDLPMNKQGVPLFSSVAVRS